MVRTEKMELMVLMVYPRVETEALLLVETEGMEVEVVMVGMLMEGTEARLMVVTEVTVGMEVQPLQKMGVMLLVVMAVTAVEVVTEVLHLVVLDEAMKSCRFQYTKLSFHLH